MDPRRRARLEELLAERATQGLGPIEERELAGLLSAHPGEADADRFELAAAEVELALLGHLDAMPPVVRERLSATGRAWVQSRRG
jgi:hypothetical protein